MKHKSTNSFLLEAISTKILNSFKFKQRWKFHCPKTACFSSSGTGILMKRDFRHFSPATHNSCANKRVEKAYFHWRLTDRKVLCGLLWCMGVYMCPLSVHCDVNFPSQCSRVCPSPCCHDSAFHFIGCIYPCVCVMLHQFTTCSTRIAAKMLLKYFNMILFITVYHLPLLSFEYGIFQCISFWLFWYNLICPKLELISELRNRQDTYNAKGMACHTCKHIYVYKSSNKSRTPHKCI